MVDTSSLIRILEQRAETSPDRIALSIWTDGKWRDLSYQTLIREVRALGGTLIELGVSPGSHVMILSESRPEWAVGFFAVLFAGAIVVPVDPRIEPEELQRLAEHCEPRVILVSPVFRKRAPEIGATIIFLGEVATPHSAHDSRNRLEDVAVLAYTSGTTGAAKGVMITGSSLLYEMRSLATVHRLRDDDVFLSVLPLNHLFELTCGLLAVLYAGGEVLFAGTLLPADLAEKMNSRGVTSMIAVPALFRTLKKAIEGVYSGRLARMQFRIAHVLARLIPHRLWRRLLFLRLHRLAGGRMRLLSSGGSPLSKEIVAFFDRLGVPIYQGYGLTESSPVVSVNNPRASRHGSVGRPLPGTEIAIDSEGQILVRGPQVMLGYYKAPELTAEVLNADGWLHTGDLGVVNDGFLFVTGRSKDLIVLADGRKVHPEEVEQALSKSAMVKEVCVLGLPSEWGDEICAVVVPVDGADSEAVERDVRTLALKLRDFKRPRKVIVRPSDLPKTRTLKILRNAVKQWVEAQR